jgi:hypothetical protein
MGKEYYSTTKHGTYLTRMKELQSTGKRLTKYGITSS